MTLTQHPTRAGSWQARGYYRDANNRRREVTASGTSRTSATNALTRKVRDAAKAHEGGDSTLNEATTMGAAAAQWLDWKARQRNRGKPLAPQTLADYRGYVRRCITGSDIEHLTVVQTNDIARLETWLAKIADERGETAARQARKVVGGILDLAERRGAIPMSVVGRVKTPGASVGSAGDRRCTDPECDFACEKRHLDTRRAFTRDEVAAVLAAAEASGADIGDLAHFLFGTGVRISEALRAVSWVDLDLDAGTVRVRGTKTAAADRVLTLSPELVDRLRRRKVNVEPVGLVFGVTRFPALAGKPRDRNNVLKLLRNAFKVAGVEWAGSHTFRRTVATWLDEGGAPLSEIANQLGHADTNVTANYLGRQAQPTRAASVMTLGTR